MAQRSVATRVGLTRRRLLALAALPLAACGGKRSPDLPPPAADAFDWNAFLKQWSDESLSLLRSLGPDYGFDAERRLVERASARFDGASEAAAASPPIAGERMLGMLVVSDDPENLFEAMPLDPAALGR